MYKCLHEFFMSYSVCSDYLEKQIFKMFPGTIQIFPQTSFDDGQCSFTEVLLLPDMFFL